MNVSSQERVQAGALSREKLFELVAEEVFGDGTVDPTENKILNALAKFLNLEAGAAREIVRAARSRFDEGELGQARSFDPENLYRRTVGLVYADGVLDDAEDAMLRALRRLFRIADSAHQRYVAEFSGAVATPEAKPPEEPRPRRTFQELFCEHVAASLDKQFALVERVGEQHTYALDTQEGKIVFDKGSFGIQLLGTVTQATQTWTWAWAEEEELHRPDLLVAARELRDLGIEEDIYELSEPTVRLEDIDPHQLATVACGVCRAQAYYRATHERGDLYVLVCDESLVSDPPDSLARVMTIFPQVVERFTVNQLQAFVHYLNHYGIHHSVRTLVQAQSATGTGVAVEFDELDRFLRSSQ